jgi:hypothetical protein
MVCNPVEANKRSISNCVKDRFENSRHFEEKIRKKDSGLGKVKEKRVDVLAKALHSMRVTDVTPAPGTDLPRWLRH